MAALHQRSLFRYISCVSVKILLPWSQTTESMMSLERIQDQIGYLVLNEDGAVIASGGELENSEHVANIVTGLISLADNILPDEEGYKKISVTYSNFSYVICLSNKKLYVLKKRHASTLPSPATTMPEIVEVDTAVVNV